MQVSSKTDLDIGEHVCPRQQPRLLEHDPHGRSRVVERVIAKGDAAMIGLLQPGEQSQQSALAAAATTIARN
jgi:hypothetical protein